MRLALCCLVMLAACSSHEVRCDAHLLPINPPARTQVPGAGAPSARAAAKAAPASAPPPEAR
jgi:uncharacterized lipoprotein YmbA